MLAGIGLSADKIKDVIEDQAADQVCIANLNSPKQIVVSGEKEQINAIKTSFESAGALMVIPLKVSGAFHSTLMTAGRQSFATFLNTFSFKTPQIPVISNVTAEAYQSDAVSDLLLAQITGTVLWTESIHQLLEKGEVDFKEVGPGKVLTGLFRQIRSSVKT